MMSSFRNNCSFLNYKYQQKLERVSASFAHLILRRAVKAPALSHLLLRESGNPIPKVVIL